MDQWFGLILHVHFKLLLVPSVILFYFNIIHTRIKDVYKSHIIDEVVYIYALSFLQRVDIYVL